MGVLGGEVFLGLMLEEERVEVFVFLEGSFFLLQFPLFLFLSLF